MSKKELTIEAIIRYWIYQEEKKLRDANEPPFVIPTEAGISTQGRDGSVRSFSGGQTHGSPLKTCGDNILLGDT